VVALLFGMTACSSPPTDAGPPAADSVSPEPTPAPSRPTVDEEATAAPQPAPAPEPDPEPEPPPVPAGRDEVIQRVGELLAAAQRELAQAELTVLVTDEYGRELGAVAADAPVMPASTLKIVTAAATLLALGPEARLVTRVDATAPIDAAGVIDGRLVLVGSGDPTLATPEYGRWIYPSRPRTPLEALADQLVDAGLRRVTGGILAVAPGFAGPTEATGWLPRYFSNFDARYITGLTVDAGLATSIRWPELEREREESGAVTEPEPESDGGDGDADTAEAPGPISIPLTGTREEIEQRLAGLDAPLARVEVVADPRAQAAAELARLLDERGVEVEGGIQAVSGAAAAGVSGLAQVQSPPLADILRFAVQRSDNHLTDQLLHVLARHATGAASWGRGERAVLDLVAGLGIDTDGLRLADGSGLSRDDRVTARLLVELDRVMWSGPHAQTWASLQAVAGESGTLRTRLRGTPAAGRFFGKTGTLNDVTGLTGAMVGDDGTRYHLAVVGNDAEAADRWVVRALMDELALVLAADVQGCTIAAAPSPPADAGEGDGDGDNGTPTPSEPASGPLGRPPTVVVC
jgi:D-alanyl-D-alanine carboxypeptidase/D-alanyl-D-alanine-endopeptidase (penicillin-binding protein 4)